MIKKIIFVFIFFFFIYNVNAYDIVYTNPNDGNKLYKKNANDTGNGTAITNVTALTPTYSPDGNYIVYRASNQTLFKKNANDTGNGTAITSIVNNWHYYPTYSPDGNYIVYTHLGDGNKLYKKNANDFGNGTAITSIGANFPTYSPDGNYIVYKDNSSWLLYKKNANDTGNGTAITSIRGDYPIYSPDGNYIVYTNLDSGRKLYKKNANDTGDGTAITNIPSLSPVYSPDGNYIVYTNLIDGFLYKKNANDTGDGTAITNTTSYSPRYSPISGAGNSNGNYSHYIFNRLSATEGNMQQVNNTAGSTTFSNHTQVKSNFLANYSYMQTWYEAKGLTLDVINNNVDWNNGVTFSKTDVVGGMLNGYKLSAHYSFMSYRETDNHDSSIYWRTNLESTSFQTDTTWTNVGVPAYPIRNGSGNIVAYLEFPCGNLICKDQYCSDVKKIINPTPINPIIATHIGVDTLNPTAPYCGDTIKNTMDEECDTNDGIRHDLGETCNTQCKVVIGGITPGCPFYAGLGYSCNGSISTPIFATVPVNQPPVPTYSGFGVDKNTMKSDTLTATDNENDTLTFAKFSDPAHGTLNVLANGSFTYTPSLNYIGADSFFYSVSDGVNGVVTQEVTIVVNDVVVGNNPPVPTFNSFSVNQGGVYSDVLTATDTENDVLSYLSIITTTHGILNVNSDGSFTYTPDVGYSGNDTFTYAVSDGHNLPVEQIVNIVVNGTGGNSSVINWTPPGNITMPVIGDINTNTGMTDTENTISDNVVCSVINEGYKNSNSIIVTNTMADTSFLNGLKGKSEYIKTLTGSSIDIVDKIISKKIKTSKLNNKSNLYDLGTKGTVSGIQFNLTKIPNSAVMRKLVKLAIDHSSTTMADYEQTVKDSCNGTITSTGTMVVPAGFIDVNEKGETLLNLFRYNGN